MAGLDIMLDKKTGKPRIIEINGQGDLLYADIYGENRIYGAQIRRMARGRAQFGMERGYETGGGKPSHYISLSGCPAL